MHCSQDSKSRTIRSRRSVATSSGKRDRLERESLQIFAKLRAEVVALECEFDCGLQHAEFVARIVTLAFECEAKYFFFFEQSLDAVGELDLATGAGGGS